MTQGPQAGQAAPMSTTGFSPSSATRDAGTDAPASGGPSPSTPTTSTPWGSTSTAPGTPHWSSTPLGTADAPTGSVPLVQGPPVSSAGPGTGDASRPSRPRGPRRARLQLRHINPWTVLKFSCVLSIALFFVWLIVIGVLFGVLDGAGVINKINDAYTTIQGSDAKPPVTAGVVFGGAAIVGVVNIVLFIALTTVGSVVYNLCADLVGGIEITLSER
jgi:Transmembrane domain of unknown function (DUF3566)